MMPFFRDDENFQKWKVKLKHLSTLLNLDIKLNGFQKDSEEKVSKRSC